MKRLMQTISVPTEKGEPMVDCKKCLHAPVCEKLPKMPGAIIAECAEFKDSTKWVERPKGRWIEHIHFDAFGSPNGANYECPVCHYDDVYDETDCNFCPNCGADMRESESE